MTIVDNYLPGVLKTDIRKLKGEHYPPSLNMELLIWFQFWSLSDANLLHCFNIARRTKNRGVVRVYLDVLAKRGYGVRLYHMDEKMYLHVYAAGNGEYVEGLSTEEKVIEEIQCQDEEEWSLFIDPPEPLPFRTKTNAHASRHLHRALLPLDASASMAPGVKQDIVLDRNTGTPMGWWQKNPKVIYEGRVVYVTDTDYVLVEDIQDLPSGDRFVHVAHTSVKDVRPWEESITERDPLE